MSFLTDEECKKVTEKVLSYAKAPETVVYVNPVKGGNTRFARNDVTTSGYTETLTVRVTSQYGLKSGTAQTNQLDDESLRDVVRRAEEIARLAPEDPETMPVLGPQKYQPSPNLFSADSADASPAYRGAIVADALAIAREKELESAGFIQQFADADAIATSKGLFAYRRTTGVTYSLTMRSPGAGSGWAGGVANSVKGFDAKKLSARAAELAKASENPVALEPGNYTAILSAEAVADLARTLAFGFNQRTIDEGRSFLSKFQAELKDGKRIFGDKVFLYSDFTSKDVPANNFDGEGLPLENREWISEGVVKNIVCDRYWAKKTSRPVVPPPANLIMKGGTQSFDELVQGCKRGIVVTRFWYVRPVDPQTALFTGLTRDGTFLVENGKITRAVKNFRWNETGVKMLRNIEAMGPSRRVITSEEDLGSGLMFPDMRVSDFTFSSLSDAV